MEEARSKEDSLPDWWQPGAMARDRLPNASLTLFSGCSHMPFFEDPERYLHTVNQFTQDTTDQVLPGLP